MKYIFIIQLFLISVFSVSQEINKQIIDEQSNQKMLIGKCTKQVFFQEPYKLWYLTEFERYVPSKDISYAKKYMNDQLKIMIIFGTWCSDTQEQLPRFYKVMDMLGYSPNTIELIAVDRNKQAEAIDLNVYKVKKVPTFIFYRNGKEIGRIVEKPSKSMEDDIVEILKK